MSGFEKDFLENYLKLGLGSMPKSDIDALVMHLLDTHGRNGSGSLAIHSNQAVSEYLKTPVKKIKKLRYDAVLKFGGRIEDQAMGRLLAALSKASLEPDGNEVCLIIEDLLAYNWLKALLKMHNHTFDRSLDSEIIKISSADIFQVLDTVFNREVLEIFKSDYETVRKEKNEEIRVNAFQSIALSFAQGAAKAEGAGVVKVLKAHIKEDLLVKVNSPQSPFEKKEVNG